MDASECPAASFSSRDPERNLTLRVSAMSTKKAEKTSGWNREKITHLDVSENSGTPKSSILIGFSIIFTIHFGGFPPIFGNTHLCPGKNKTIFKKVPSFLGGILMTEVPGHQNQVKKTTHQKSCQVFNIIYDILYINIPLLIGFLHHPRWCMISSINSGITLHKTNLAGWKIHLFQ